MCVVSATQPKLSFWQSLYLHACYTKIEITISNQCLHILKVKYEGKQEMGSHSLKCHPEFVMTPFFINILNFQTPDLLL